MWIINFESCTFFSARATIKFLVVKQKVKSQFLNMAVFFLKCLMLLWKAFDVVKRDLILGTLNVLPPALPPLCHQLIGTNWLKQGRNLL